MINKQDVREAFEHFSKPMNVIWGKGGEATIALLKAYLSGELIEPMSEEEIRHEVGKYWVEGEVGGDYSEELVKALVRRIGKSQSGTERKQ